MPPPIEMTTVQLYGEDFEIPKIIADAARKQFSSYTDSDVERVAEALRDGAMFIEPMVFWRGIARAALDSFLKGKA